MSKLISIVLPDLRGGGAERVNLDLADEFSSAGHRVEIVLLRAEGEFLKEARDKFEVVDLRCARVRQAPLALARYLNRSKPDALLAVMWPLTVLVPLVSRISGFDGQVLLSEHGILSAQYSSWGFWHRALLKFTTAIGYRMANSRIGVSEGVVNDMASLSWMGRSNFQCINNPITPRIAPSSQVIDITDAIWSAPRGGRILTVGTMKAVKNQELLLGAFARLDRPDARLIFVGTGPERQSLVSLANELDIVDRVIFAGFHKDPTPFYKTADLFVLSSNYEGFGNVIVEAMACGTPVVSTDCPSGPAEILENGKYGRLVPVRDPEALAAAIQASLDAPSEPEILKNRASDFLPAIAANRYLELLCP